MSDVVTANVTSLKKFQKETAKGTFDLVEATLDSPDLKKISGYPSQFEGIKANDLVDVTVKRDGRFTKLLSISTVVGEPVQATETTKSPFKTAESVREISTPSTRTTSSVSKLEKTSKDLSQEISGILQALINTGLYHQVKQNDDPKLGASTFLSDKLLEVHLNRILDLKNKLMNERS